MKLPPQKIILFAIFIELAALAYIAFVYEPSRLVVNNYSLKLQNWSANQNGFKIVAISDIHGGCNFVTEERIREIVRQANAQNPDLIVLLGDYFSRRHFEPGELNMPIETVIKNLEGLKAKYGVYAVIGNQDNEIGGKRVRLELEQIGYHGLENEVAAIEHNGEWIRLLGVDDILKLGNKWWDAGLGMKSRLDKYWTKEGKVIVLTHNPDTIVYLTEQLSISPEFSLMIAGHTHGGQCRFPLIGRPIVPSSFGEKYAAGHVRDKGIDLFVTTGIGMSSLPVRFGVPPEIAVLQLYAE